MQRGCASDLTVTIADVVLISVEEEGEYEEEAPAEEDQ